MRFYLLRSMRCSENYRFTYLQYRLLKETGQNGWVANNIIPCDSKLHANKLDKQCSKKHIYCWNKTDLCTIRKSLNFTCIGHLYTYDRSESDESNASKQFVLTLSHRGFVVLVRFCYDSSSTSFASSIMLLTEKVVGCRRWALPRILLMP